MEHLHVALAAHGISILAIDQLAAFESRDRFSLLDEIEFEQKREYLGGFPVYQFLVPLLTFHRYQPALAKLTELTTTAQHNGQLAAKMALRKIVAS